MKRLTPRIATESSIDVLRQWSSHVWKQTRAHTAANGLRLRCSASASAYRLLAHERYEAGHVDPGGTRALTRRADEPRADTRGAMTVADVLLVLVPEVADRREDRVRRGLSEAAERRLL